MFVGKETFPVEGGSAAFEIVRISASHIGGPYLHAACLGCGGLAEHGCLVVYFSTDGLLPQLFA